MKNTSQEKVHRDPTRSQTSISGPAGVLERARQIALRQNKSFSQYVIALIQQDVAPNEFPVPDPRPRRRRRQAVPAPEEQAPVPADPPAHNGPEQTQTA